MKKIIGIIFLMISLVSFSSSAKAPYFNLKDQYGVVHSLENYKGKVIFLNFWATWCPPCKKEMPDIENIYKEYGENKKDVVILGVNSEKENEVKKFLKDKGYTFPTVIDENSEVMRKYFIQAFPTSFVIDKEGNVYGYVMGGLTKEQIKQVIEEVLKK
ncbi:TlpA disulfide reductase family protein [uncultured Fusobacterium sp.]|uniref:TlpA family protein disulfide reductase n=1 Tax=uncultured Fusobacterium sp. TaxID=159267 RepID=UPI0027DB8AE8|nr:TlpA disulfide reductase family protein [uncultured Fusobacterium sp.]